MKTYYAKIRLPDGSYQVTTIRASDNMAAKRLLEARYGAGRVVGIPTTKKFTETPLRRL